MLSALGRSTNGQSDDFQQHKSGRRRFRIPWRHSRSRKEKSQTEHVVTDAVFRCVNAVAISGSSFFPCIGTYTRTSIPPSVQHAGRVIYKGPGSKHLFYWADINKWIVGNDYNSQLGWLCSGNCDSWCPTGASGWREWDNKAGEFRKLNAIRVLKATETSDAHELVEADLTSALEPFPPPTPPSNPSPPATPPCKSPRLEVESPEKSCSRKVRFELPPSDEKDEPAHDELMPLLSTIGLGGTEAEALAKVLAGIVERRSKSMQVGSTCSSEASKAQLTCEKLHAATSAVRSASWGSAILELADLLQEVSSSERSSLRFAARVDNDEDNLGAFGFANAPDTSMCTPPHSPFKRPAPPTFSPCKPPSTEVVTDAVDCDPGRATPSETSEEDPESTPTQDHSADLLAVENVSKFKASLKPNPTVGAQQTAAQLYASAVSQVCEAEKRSKHHKHRRRRRLAFLPRRLKLQRWRHRKVSSEPSIQCAVSSEVSGEPGIQCAVRSEPGKPHSEKFVQFCDNRNEDAPMLSSSQLPVDVAELCKQTQERVQPTKAIEQEVEDEMLRLDCSPEGAEERSIEVVQDDHEQLQMQAFRRISLDARIQKARLDLFYTDVMKESMAFRMVLEQVRSLREQLHNLEFRAPANLKKVSLLDQYLRALQFRGSGKKSQPPQSLPQTPTGNGIRKHSSTVEVTMHPSSGEMAAAWRRSMDAYHACQPKVLPNAPMPT